MITSSSRASPLTDYEIELSKTQRDVAALKAFCFANPADVEKHVRLAYRQFQRGDLLLAGVFLAVGIVLTVYRLRRLGRPAAAGNLNPPS